MDTVLITGCSTGIGRATAEAFLDDGWRVHATARAPSSIGDLGDRGAEIAALDVTDDAQIQSVLDGIIEDGQLDCLVNNAGYAQFGPIEDLPVETVSRQFDVNVFGPHRLTRAVLPHFREQGAGRIINLSSVAGRLAVPVAGAYAGSKFALEAMSDALRSEVDRYGIDVVLIEPGPVETEFADRAERELRAGTERSGAYEDLYEIAGDFQLLSGSGPLAIRPERVADAILDSATRASPPDRVTVGPIARWVRWARFVPDRWKDTVYRMIRLLA